MLANIGNIFKKAGRGALGRVHGGGESTGLEGDIREKLSRCANKNYYLSLLTSIEPEVARGADAVELYLSSPLHRIISLNPFFDEMYYRRVYPDVAEHIAAGALESGLVHFIVSGFEEGRVPSKSMNDLMKACVYPASEVSSSDQIPEWLFGSEVFLEFLQYFSFLDRVTFYNRYGRFFVSQDDTVKEGFVNKARYLFDASYYREKYYPSEQFSTEELFADYLSKGIKHGYSPNSNFDERFYLAFYPDVKQAVQKGVFCCGYQHFLASGEREGRLPRYIMEKALEVRYAGLSAPVGITRTDELQRKLEMPFFLDESRVDRCINVVIPDMNPDIFFGGYDTIVNLITLLRGAGKKLRVIKTESADSSLDYLRYHWEPKGKFQPFADLEVCSRADVVPVGPNDRFIAYSVWDAYLASRMASVTTEPRIVSLLQEYEPIFTDNNAFHFLANAAYSLPHYPIFNSRELVDFFRNRRLSVFAEKPEAKEGEDYSVVQHVLQRLQTSDFDPARSERTFFYYARPEPHAGRNLFEIGIMALRDMLSRHSVGDEWRFVGLGALTDSISPVRLGGGHVMEVRAKMPIEDYTRLIRDVDVGLSLMWAPHPSVIPFELLQTGAVVVTNTYENRSKSYLEGFSANLIAAEPTVRGISDALWEAFEKSGDLERRKAGVIRLGPDSWQAAFEQTITNLEEKDLI